MDDSGVSVPRGREASRMLRAVGLVLGVAGLLATAPPGSAQEFGAVGGTPVGLAKFQLTTFEQGQFGDVAILCLQGGCQTQSRGLFVQYDQAVWGDIRIDAGDQFDNEEATTVRHTFAGSVVGTVRADTSTADLACLSVPAAGASERRCIKVLEAPAGGTPSIPNLTVVKDGAFCTTLANKTVGVTTTAPPPVAYVISLDSDPTGEAGVQPAVKITVCDGFNWQGTEPGAFGETGVLVTAEFHLDVVRTPGLLLTKCRCY